MDNKKVTRQEQSVHKGRNNQRNADETKSQIDFHLSYGKNFKIFKIFNAQDVRKLILINC